MIYLKSYQPKIVDKTRVKDLLKYLCSIILNKIVEQLW